MQTGSAEGEQFAPTGQALIQVKNRAAEQPTLQLGPKKQNGFVSFLDTVGHDFEKVFSFALPAAVAAAPFVSIADPATGAAYAASIQLIAPVIGLVEQKFAAMGKQNGSGMQKLSEVVSAVYMALTGLLAAYGIKADTPLVNQLVNAVVAFLNSLPQLLPQAAPQIAASSAA